jgi:hypothetical protein
MQAGFGALVLAQAAHSVEEYLGRLWESFPPARALTSLVSQDLELGFLVINVALVTFGVWCFLWPVRRGWPSAVPLAWGWVVIETINGIGHPLWSLRQGGYTPGVATAPVLLILAIYLAGQLRKPRVTSLSTPLLLGTLTGIIGGCRPAPAARSEIPEIPGTVVCAACEIIAEEAVVLSGPASALVEWPQSAWTDSRGRIVLAQPNKQIMPAAFGPDGRFLQHLGGEGEGPGEFRYAAHLAADAHDSVWIADWGTGRLSIFDPDFRFVRSFPVPRLLSLALLPDGDLVTAGRAFDGGKGPVPIHRWDRGGVRVAGYGPPVKQSSGYEHQYLVAAARNGGFWAVRLWGRLLLLRVDSAGEERWYERRPEWFRGIPVGATSADQGVSRARAIWEDAAGLVWTVFQVAADSVGIVMDTVRPEGVPVAVPRDADAAYDTMVEVLDPSRGELVAAHRFPEVLTVSAGPGRLIRVVETDAGLRISVVALRLQRP